MKKFASMDGVVDYLYVQRPHGQVKLGLESITYLLNLLGSPQLEYKTLHVAGTNGKGSTTKMLSTILMSSGFKVGANYSPHLIDFNERITVNNINIMIMRL